MQMRIDLCLICCVVFRAHISAHRFAANLQPGGSPQIINLFSNATAALIGTAELERAFNVTYNHFSKQFDTQVGCHEGFNFVRGHILLDHEAYKRFVHEFGQGVRRYTQSDAYLSYALYPDRLLRAALCARASILRSLEASLRQRRHLSFCGG